MSEHFDVLIVGAGLSGIGAAVHLGKHCPGKTYAILEAREAIGGTWDLFRYPGIRSDSDMYTLGYSFKPWTEQKAIADGPSIRKYVSQTADEYGVRPRIRFKHAVKRLSWDSQAALWTVEAEHQGSMKRFTARWVMMCAGYYRYDQGYLPTFPGYELFKGSIIHPQHWPRSFDYSGKQIVIIGSGATAVTLAPSLTDKAAHVTMLQRSPTYMVSMPAVDRVAHGLRRVLPEQIAYDVIRFLRIVMQQVFFRLARARPKATRERLLKRIEDQLGPEQVREHFTPRYNPWEERLCLVPDDDMFLAIKQGKASVVTDQIETFTETGVKLKSGRHLDADVIVTATGLALQMLGGAETWVDGRKIETGKSFAYKGTMLSDVPNLAFVFGYTNASWTLRADLISQYVCRLINYMDARGYAQVTPRLQGPMEERPWVDFSSGYFQRAAAILPKQGAAPWKQRQSYAHDLLDLRFGALDDGVLEFKRWGDDAAAAASANAREAQPAK
ncbi:MAG: NAD(P)/FAD-dependent oxidoreductase [Hyphomonadaceae bacterium]|nr:NAD(P)/FAD-dependent oxidoreductase [Hyphomonadaceae bacterium]